MSLPSCIKIVEVGPRDGLQNEKIILDTSLKLRLIEKLVEAGLKTIEVTSFSLPNLIPQLADHELLLSQLPHQSDLDYPVIIPTPEAMKKAIDLGVKHIAVLNAASETFSQRNTHCSINEGLKRTENILQLAKRALIPVRAYLSCAIACPYEGTVLPQTLTPVAKQLIEMGCYEVSLADTIGVGTPYHVKRLLDAVLAEVDVSHCAVHFHDTYGQAIANVYTALQYGIAVVDSAVGGLGGCPYAKGAAGNLATEDLVYLLEGLQIKTGVDLKKLVSASH
ncbi:MAG: hydroxymethylglutaryl-CoA lyase, mitochondrial-like, partial [Gammaproteobacteria bacterium]|nr:hydroxymethylglutaryl-CoA lyase, mitochondrial-like [Gammaproteobacteria bacterium]